MADCSHDPSINRPTDGGPSEVSAVKKLQLTDTGVQGAWLYRGLDGLSLKTFMEGDTEQSTDQLIQGLADNLTDRCRRAGARERDRLTGHVVGRKSRQSANRFIHLHLHPIRRGTN